MSVLKDLLNSTYFPIFQKMSAALIRRSVQRAIAISVSSLFKIEIDCFFLHKNWRRRPFLYISLLFFRLS
jgi:hypothetical protein